MVDFARHTVRVSAPSKLMLLGEHAVVHGRPCLVTAMDARLFMTLVPAESGDNAFTIRAPDVGEGITWNDHQQLDEIPVPSGVRGQSRLRHDVV